MISGKSFAQRCKWVVDPRYPEMRPFDYNAASTGDWVFINGDFLYVFMSRIPVISIKRFTLIIHNTDRSFGEQELNQLLRHALRIYAINTVVQHPMLQTIPIGFVDRQLPFLETLKMSDEPRDIEIYGNFVVSTNVAARTKCLETFKNDPRVTWKENLSVPEYYADLRRSKFVLCPDGTGIDTHRVYESLLCGATPVVLRNPLSNLYKDLPVCIVNQWTDPFYEVKDKEFKTDVQKYL